MRNIHFREICHCRQYTIRLFGGKGKFVIADSILFVCLVGMKHMVWSKCFIVVNGNQYDDLWRDSGANVA